MKSTALVITSRPNGAHRVFDVEAEAVGHHRELGARGPQRVDQRTDAGIERHLRRDGAQRGFVALHQLPLVEDALPAVDRADDGTARRWRAIVGRGALEHVHTHVDGGDGAVEVEEHRRAGEVEAGEMATPGTGRR